MGMVDSGGNHSQDGVDMAAGAGNSRPGAPRQVMHMVHGFGGGAKEQMNVLVLIHQPSPFLLFPFPGKGKGNQWQFITISM